MKYLDKNDVAGRFSKTSIKSMLKKQDMGNHMLEIKPLAEEQAKTGGTIQPTNEPTKQNIKQMFKIDFNTPKKNKIPQNNIKLVL